jgi:aspartate-semialdehyde dehydrogenase
MARAGLRIGIVGATGALGGEVLTALDASSLRVAAIRPMATEASIGQDVEFQGEIYPVEAGVTGLASVDVVLSCVPPAAALECVREALHAEVPCVDCSGALTGSAEVPVGVAWRGLTGADDPVVAALAGPALAWSLALAPLHERANVTRVLGTALEAASAAGRGGIDALYGESIALFNQEDPPEPEAIGRPLAFDCLPTVGPPEDGGATLRESLAEIGLRRVLGEETSVSVAAIHVPAFVGHAGQIAIETEQALDPKEAQDLLAGSPGVEYWTDDAAGPNLRAGAGRDVVIVGRLRRDPSSERGLLLWVVSDPLRLAAANAIALAAARFEDDGRA